MRQAIRKIKNTFNAVSPYAFVPRAHLAHADFVLHRGQTLGASTLRDYAYAITDQDRVDLARFLDTLGVVLQRRGAIESQLLQDVFALTVSNERHKTFVEVGAAKPRELSNTFLLQQDFGWTGILVEPNPRHVTQLAQREVPGEVSVEPVAVGTPGRITLIDADELSAVVDATSDPTHALARDAALKAGRTVEVDRVPLAEILEKRFGDPQRLGFLSIDVEGAEMAVLESNDWSAWSFCAITLEHNYRPESIQAYDNILLAAGYRPFLRGFSSWDAWYVHQDWG